MGVSSSNVTLQKYEPVNMMQLLSQITVKVPLLEMMRIEQHRTDALTWIQGAFEGNANTYDSQNNVQDNNPKESDVEGLVS